MPKGISIFRPMVLNPRPGLVLTLLGGWVATILLSALIFLGPLFGFPFIDIPHLMGGIFSSSPIAAFWIGFWLNFLTGMIVWPSMLSLVWPVLPGGDIGVLGSALKGLALGISLWLLSGILLPIAGWLNRLDPEVVQPPGFFGINTGLRGMAGLLLAHLVYGLALAIVAGIGEGVFVMETLGWPSHRRAETPPAGRLYPDPTMPEYPFIGER